VSKVLFDTDILIDILRGREAIRTFLLDLTDHSVPCCSVISVAELYAGMRPEEKHATDVLLDGLVIIPLVREIAEVAGRFKSRVKSRRLELADCLIAATAFVEGATLATGNTKDYPMPEITVLNPRI
jgi:predicted nucleic acid-binding protein